MAAVHCQTTTVGHGFMSTSVFVTQRYLEMVSTALYIHVYIHVVCVRGMKKEGIKKQARSNKQGKATQNTQGSHFSKVK